MGSQIVTTVTDALSGFATGLGETVVNVFDSVIVSGDGLSNVAVWGLTFLAFGLVTGIVKMFTRKVN